MPSARYQHTAVWTGNGTTRMIVWGGFDGGQNQSGDQHRRSDRPERTGVAEDGRQRLGVHGEPGEAELGGQCHQPVMVVADPLAAEIYLRTQRGGFAQRTTADAVGGLQHEDRDTVAV